MCVDSRCKRVTVCVCVCVISLYKRASMCVDSLSGGEENLEKLAELERLLAQAQTDKLKLVEEQVRTYSPTR